MTKEELLEKIQDVLEKEFEIDRKRIVKEAKLYEDLDLDSIDAVDLIVKMKGMIGGKITPDMFKSVRTIGDVVEVLFPLVEKANK